MRSIQNEEDFALVLSQKHAVLYFYVAWSTYAVQGRRMLEELESLATQDSKISFWFADVGDLEAPAAFLEGWLRQQEQPSLKMINVIASGSGSVAWLQSGVIMDFIQSAMQHNLEELHNRTVIAFHEGAT